jgi:ribosomal protein L10
VTELSSIGSRDQLLAQVLSVFNAPAQKFLGVINGIPQKFLGVLQAQADKLEEGA